MFNEEHVPRHSFWTFEEGFHKRKENDELHLMDLPPRDHAKNNWVCISYTQKKLMCLTNYKLQCLIELGKDLRDPQGFEDDSGNVTTGRVWRNPFIPSWRLPSEML